MTPDQLEKKINHYQMLLAQSQDDGITLSVRLEEALNKIEELTSELSQSQAKAAEVPAAEDTEEV